MKIGSTQLLFTFLALVFFLAGAESKAVEVRLNAVDNVSERSLAGDSITVEFQGEKSKRQVILPKPGSTVYYSNFLLGNVSYDEITVRYAIGTAEEVNSANVDNLNFPTSSEYTHRQYSGFHLQDNDLFSFSLIKENTFFKDDSVASFRLNLFQESDLWAKMADALAHGKSFFYVVAGENGVNSTLEFRPTAADLQSKLKKDIDQMIADLKSIKAKNDLNDAHCFYVKNGLHTEKDDSENFVYAYQISFYINDQTDPIESDHLTNYSLTRLKQSVKAWLIDAKKTHFCQSLKAIR